MTDTPADAFHLWPRCPGPKFPIVLSLPVVLETVGILHAAFSGRWPGTN